MAVLDLDSKVKCPGIDNIYMEVPMRSYYEWLDQQFLESLRNAGVKHPENAIGLIVANG